MVSGRDETVQIDVPPGLLQGTQLRYPGLGDDSQSELPRGNLFVHIEANRHPKFIRENYNLVYQHTIDCFDAMLGSEFVITHLDKRKLKWELNELMDAGLCLSGASKYLAKKNNLTKSFIFTFICTYILRFVDHFHAFQSFHCCFYNIKNII